MLKIPFIEHTGIGIEITQREVRWFEVNRLGKRLSLKSLGEVIHNNSDASFQSAVEQLKAQIESEAFHLGITIPEALVQVVVEEVPYSEEEEETGYWINQKKQELMEAGKEEDVLVQYHLIQLDEDSKRCVFQVLDARLITRYQQLLYEMELFPQYVGAGLLESGYSQIYNQDFLEGTSSIIQYLNRKTYLTVFENGLVKNVYEIGESHEADVEYILNEAHSYLQTEEASTDRTLNSISVHLVIQDTGTVSGKDISEREVHKLIPLRGKKGLEEISSEYLQCAGTIVRLFFPGLDTFNYSESSTIQSGVLFHDKKETIRLGMLLFAPLIIFVLCTYAFNKVVDYRLVESNQVMDQIGDRIEEVTQKRELLIETRDRFVDARNILEDKEPVSFIFEQIGTQIPDEMWLTTMSVSNNSESPVQQVRISGYSGNEWSISNFLSLLEESEGVRQASLILSLEVETSSTKSLPNPELIGATQFEILIQFSR